MTRMWEYKPAELYIWLRAVSVCTCLAYNSLSQTTAVNIKIITRQTKREIQQYSPLLCTFTKNKSVAKRPFLHQMRMNVLRLWQKGEKKRGEDVGGSVWVCRWGGGGGGGGVGAVGMGGGGHLNIWGWRSPYNTRGDKERPAILCLWIQKAALSNK